MQNFWSFHKINNLRIIFQPAFVIQQTVFPEAKSYAFFFRKHNFINTAEVQLMLHCHLTGSQKMPNPVRLFLIKIATSHQIMNASIALFLKTVLVNHTHFFTQFVHVNRVMRRKK